MLIPLDAADERCGGKAVTLARLLREGFAVPPGFVIADAIGADGWVQEIGSALQALGGGPVAVRSSARGEDGAGASFAGQLHTALGVSGQGEVVREVRRAAASGASPETIAYAARVGRGLDAVVPVIVQAMVPAEVAGVLFTRHPVTGAEQVVIEAGRGLGDQVVGGTVAPRTWVVDGRAVTGSPGGGDQLLTTAQVLGLAEIGHRTAATFGCPQDVEWAVADGSIWVLQARPITALPGLAERASPAPDRVLATGTPASPGTATGAARVIGGLDDFARFRDGDVLVCRTTSPAWTPLLARAAAVVTEIGGLLAHAAIVAREFGIPAVLAAPDAMRKLTDGQQVHVDGAAGTVSAQPAQPAQPAQTARPTEPAQPAERYR